MSEPRPLPRLSSEASPPHSTPRRGKAPPVNEFTGDAPYCTLEDWLPSLERAVKWNAWTEEERLIQLAGHLKSRALQEWNLLRPEDRASFTRVVEALRSRLDCGSKTLAAQDFRHATQRDGESVSEFVRCLERVFRTAYGREPMSAETKDMLLYGQLQEGLHLQLMRSPAVSGAKDYQELIVVARNEERRLVDLRRRQEYARSNSKPSQSSSSNSKDSGQQSFRPRSSQYKGNSKSDQPPESESKTEKQNERKCYHCKKPEHLLYQCPLRQKKEGGSKPLSSAKKILTEPALEGSEDAVPSSDPQEVEEPIVKDTRSTEGDTQPEVMNPLSLFFSESDDEGDVMRVMVTDHGSRPQLARVDIQGVPADGIVDTAADITIMGGKLFALVASSAKLRKKDFKPADRVPKTYDRKVFHLDGRMELEVWFQEKAMKTMVYIKMDAPDQLLLSEGVCRQLGIVTYHPSLHQPDQAQSSDDSPTHAPHSPNKKTTLVPCVRVNLVESLKFPPSHSTVVQVKDDFNPAGQTMFVESRGDLEKDTGLIVEDAVLPQPMASRTLS